MSERCERLPTYSDLHAQVERFRTALLTISTADHPDAPISRESCALVARQALREPRSMGDGPYWRAEIAKALEN